MGPLSDNVRDEGRMNYLRKYFNPAIDKGSVDQHGRASLRWERGGQRDVYVFAPKVTLAVNVARATNRPLLVAGEPGSGKSRLAAAVASCLGWQFYAHTVTSKTQASDLLWTYDALGRFNDANTPNTQMKPRQSYVQPGVVWWAFDPGSASERGLDPRPKGEEPLSNPALSTRRNAAVVLIDEIDKADPDVPNDLLEPFDVQAFTVRDTDQRIVATRDVFLMLTTNGERELPAAFLRRCVLLVLDEPDADWFALVARQHFPKGRAALQRRIAAEVMRLRETARASHVRKPSTAEFLDALRVCQVLQLDEHSKDWDRIVESVLLKNERQQDRPV